MTLDEFKAAVKAKNDADLEASKTSEACESAILATLSDAERIFRKTNSPQPALDPAFWLALFQVLAPIILEWINRRFPKPTTPATP